jgi:hypothetical protein
VFIAKKKLEGPWQDLQKMYNLLDLSTEKGYEFD